MIKTTLPQSSKFTSPNPVTLVCTLRPDGTTNLATVAWYTILSYNPWMIGYAMAKTSYSGELVRSNKKVIVTIPGSELKEQVYQCGSCSGRDVDKAKKFNVPLQKVDDSPIQIPANSRLAFVCDLKEFHEVGDHYFYMCNVGNVLVNENEKPLFGFDGFAQMKTVE